jgi:fused signal recognition particle receptor
MVVVIIVVAIVVVAIGVLVGVRMSARTKERRAVPGEPVAPPRPGPTVEAPSVEELEALLQAPSAPDVVLEPEVVAEPEVLEPEVFERPRLRDRLGRTRSAFSGAFGRIRGRKIDDETWDEIEESLLLADVGMFTTTRLLDALRVRA